MCMANEENKGVWKLVAKLLALLKHIHNDDGRFLTDLLLRRVSFYIFSLAGKHLKLE